MSDRNKLRDWMFRALMFEADSDRFRQAGIRVGVDEFGTEQRLFEEELAPFPLVLRNNSLRMSRLYALLHCFENSVRILVRERLEQKFQLDWWQKGIPTKIRTFAEGRKKDAVENSWLQGDTADLLSFVDFGHLAQIITENWDAFSDLIPSQVWLKQRFDEMEKARNFVAHSRVLLPTEFVRLEMYIADWNTQVGV